MDHRRTHQPVRRWSRPLAAATALCLLTGIPMAFTASAAEASTRISVNVPATASTTQFGPGNAAEANDDNPGTRWASAQGDADATPWIQYDLAQACTVTGAEVNWEGAYASDYSIVGWTGAEWAVVKQVTGVTGASAVTLDAFAAVGKLQHVALVVDTKATPWGASIWELQYLGTDCEPSAQPAPSALPSGYVSDEEPGEEEPGEEEPGEEEPGEPNRGELLSAGRPATATSAENAATVAAGINDSDPTTRWGSAHRDGESVTIDLEGTALIDTIDIDHDPAAFIREYRVETSVNGWVWDEFAHVTDGDGVDVSHSAPGAEPVQARFVRLHSLVRGTQWGSSVFELEVFGTGYVAIAPPQPEGGNGGELLSYLKDGTASSSQDDSQCAGCLPARMFDRDPSTRWATAPSETWENPAGWDGLAWVVLDLEAQAQLTQIVLQWDPAYATAYDIFVGDDIAGPWTQIYGTTTGEGGREIIDLAGENGRYVRIELNERAMVWGAQYGYSLSEFRVYGTGGSPIVPPPLPTDPDFGALELVWSDEFNARKGAAADPTKWILDASSTSNVNNNELQLYTDDTNNVRHDGEGNLVIEAKEEEFHGAGLYTSGRLNTSQTFLAQYGRFEARVKVPEGQGLWPAFWMMGENFLEGTPWPSNGEIDIMEVLGHDTSTTYTTIHGPGYSGMGGIGQSHAVDADLSEGFHVYSVDWDSTGMTFHLDGQEVFRIDRTLVEDERNQAWVYDQPFYMILNLAVGGDWPGSPDADTAFPATMLVDYVRVYQSEGSGAVVDKSEDGKSGNGKAKGVKR